MFWHVILMAVMFVLICLFMMLVILIQKPRGGGLSAAFGGGGGAGAAFGAKTGDVLTWFTVICFVVFLLLAMGLTWSISPDDTTQKSSLTSEVEDEQEETAASELVEELAEPGAQSAPEQEAATTQPADE